MSILYRVENGVAILEIDRPEVKNALNQEMYAALTRGLASAAQDDDVRSLLVMGQPGAFCAGNELTEFVNNPPTDADSPVLRFMFALTRFEKPVVAAVTGHAVGIGATLLLHCDLVYVASKARLSMPFVKLGLVPEFAASLLLPQRAGYLRAAEEAVAVGLANMVVPDEQVVDVAREVAERFNALPPEGVRETKRLLRESQRRPVEDRILEEARLFGARLGGPEVREAVAAFFEKREPDFSRVAQKD
jgi:enoyl-CoA hydratase/carnithine racemase